MSPTLPPTRGYLDLGLVLFSFQFTLNSSYIKYYYVTKHLITGHLGYSYWYPCFRSNRNVFLDLGISRFSGNKTECSLGTSFKVYTQRSRWQVVLFRNESAQLGACPQLLVDGRDNSQRKRQSLGKNNFYTASRAISSEKQKMILSSSKYHSLGTKFVQCDPTLGTPWSGHVI